MTYIVTFLIFCFSIFVFAIDMKNFGKNSVKLRDYQIEINIDSIHLYNGDKYVGGTTLNQCINNIFIKDNNH